MPSSNLARRRPYDICRLMMPEVDKAADVLLGLRLPQKQIDPKYFYDRRGSQLFEKIAATDEYYPTRTENEILSSNALAIARTVGKVAAIVEPGAGNCRKIEYLLWALRPELYVPTDVAAAMLDESCARLATAYRWIDYLGVIAEFDQVELIAELLPRGRRLAFFPGSTLGNMEPLAAMQFLRRLRRLVQLDGGVLIGVDNVKNEDVLNLAYNDAAGITAAFNKNVLVRLNRTIAANFAPDKFRHRAFFNAAKSRIEMHLVSRRDQIVDVAGEVVRFDEGETIHTENSYKYARESFLALAAEAGLKYVDSWSDAQNYFTVYYLENDPETVMAEQPHGLESSAPIQ